MSGADVIKDTHPRACRVEFQSSWNAFVGQVVRGAPMPLLVAGQIIPVGQQPNFLRLIDGTNDIKPKKPGGMLNLMRPVQERMFDLGAHPIGHSKLAKYKNHFCSTKPI
jgi:hypothetical protein